MRNLAHDVDLCVVGGGISGLCTAVAAARNGIRVALMQDRPVLGGNASSEIRMWLCGARGDNNRETGLVEEIVLENYYRNTNLSYSIWDSILYEKARFEPNITLLLNCSCLEAEENESTIKSIKGWQLTTETYHTVRAKYFADCSGDSILAVLTSAEFMLGREAKSEFGESIPPEVSDKKTMGLSCLFQTRETSKPQKFIKPEWAYTYKSREDLPYKDLDLVTNFWGIELGGDKDSIHDTEELRDELLKIAFGVWDHMKNQGDYGCESWVMDWIGFLPGKRESRRYAGEYIINENDVLASGKFDDIVAYGGWPMDDHFPAGFNHKESYPTILHPAPSPWGIPLRSLYSKNIKNLMFAGRNISVTHAALSSCRVMSTCGIMGQAVGTAAAMCVKNNVDLRSLDVKDLQQQLMYDDCYIPWHKREISELMKSAKASTPTMKNGLDRPIDGEFNGFIGELMEYNFETEAEVKEIRLIFDSNLNRDFTNMPCNFKLNEPNYKTPETLIKSYKILADDKIIVENKNNYQRMVKHKLNIKAKSLKFIPLETWGEEGFRVFAFDVK